MTRPRILLAEPLDRAAESELAQRAEIVRPAGAGTDALAAAVPGCHGAIVRTSTPVAREWLIHADKLSVIGVAGVGLDRVDLAACEERGIAVLSRPGAASQAVAELAVQLMLALLRPLDELRAKYRAGHFAEARQSASGRELEGLRVGIVGLGRIGSRVGRICAAFGAQVAYHDIVPIGPLDFAANAVSVESLWTTSDVISIHCPLTDQTHRMASQSLLQQMRPGSLLVNTARGAIIDTSALLAALQDGPLGGAGLDVTDPEPLPPQHPLWTAPRCILTPHVGARTEAGLRRMFGIWTDVVAYLQQRTI